MPQSTSQYLCNSICNFWVLCSVVQNIDTAAENVMIAPLCCSICFGNNYMKIDCLYCNKLSDPLCCSILLGSNHETKDNSHFNKSYGNRKQFLEKEKDPKSTPISLLTGSSICCIGSQSVVQAKYCYY